MADASHKIKARWAQRRSELKNAGYQKIGGQWRKIGWAPSNKPRITDMNAPVTDLQKQVRAAKRKAFMASGYQKQNGEWVRTVKGLG